MIEIEDWNAHSTSKEAANDFYNFVLAEDARMLFPGGRRQDGDSGGTCRSNVEFV